MVSVDDAVGDDRGAVRVGETTPGHAMQRVRGKVAQLLPAKWSPTPGPVAGVAVAIYLRMVEHKLSPSGHAGFGYSTTNETPPIPAPIAGFTS